MKEENNDIAIKVDHVYKSFNVYYDRANTLKERLLFIGRNKKREKREILNDINIDIKNIDLNVNIGTEEIKLSESLERVEVENQHF